MSKPLPSNNMPWPDNLIYDFSLSPDTTPEAAEKFINSVDTSDRNKAFLRLRYIEGKTYKEIGTIHGITSVGVRLALKALCGKYGGATATQPSVDGGEKVIDLQDQISVDEMVSIQDVSENYTPGKDTPGTAKDNATDIARDASTASIARDASTASATKNTSTDTARDAGTTSAAQPTVDATPSSPSPKKVREELKPIITAIANTTRQRTFVYDSKARVVIPTDQVPRGLRRDSRYITLPDYYQIKEYDLMQEFATSLSATEPVKAELLNTALGGVGPFKAFRSTVRDIGLGQAWAENRYQKFAEMAEDWWEREVAPALVARNDDRPVDPAQPTSIPTAHPETAGMLIVEPNALNGIALIETIRVLYRRVGAENFEEALDELRNALCSISATASEER